MQSHIATGIEPLNNIDTFRAQLYYGGVPPFTYQWAVDGIVQADTAQTFIYQFRYGTDMVCVTITDSTGCTTSSCDTVQTPVTACTNFVVTILDSANGNLPSMMAYVHGAPYNHCVFSWSDSSTNYLTQPLQAGRTYCVTVTDTTTGCISSACQDYCFFSATVTDSITSTTNIYRAYPTGGGFGYRFFWNSVRGNSFYSTSNSTPFVSLIIVDANGCFFIDSLIPHACHLASALTYTHDAFNRYTFQTVATLGTAPLSYSWTVNGYASSVHTATLSDSLAQGTYVICSTVRDANSCSSQSCDTVVVSAPLACQLHVQVVDTVIGSDTMLFARVNDFTAGAASVSYSWSTGTTGTVDSILPGLHVYCVTVTDNLGCTASSCINTCTLTGATTAIASGNGWNQQASVSGATGIVRYHWSSGDTTAGFFTTARGVYHLTITDASGCSVVLTDTAGSVCYFSGGISVSGNNGVYATLTATVYNNHGPVNYLWSNGSSGSNVLNVQQSGQYCVTATDTIGCTTILCDSVNLTCRLRVHVVDSVVSGYHILHAIADSGRSPFTYSWHPGGTSEYNYIQHSGIYCVDLYDANGCYAYTCDTVNMGCQLSTSYTFTSNASNIYYFTSHVSGGSGHYNHGWQVDGLYTNVNDDTYYTATLSAGQHSVCLYVYDSLTACRDSFCQVITVPAIGCTLSASITQSVSGSVAVLTAHASGAHGPVTYYWPAGSTSAILTAVNSGTYCVTIRDSAGCSATACDTLHLSSCNLHATYTSTHTGSIYVFSGASTGAHGTVTYQWRIDGGTLATGSPYTATLAAGTHQVCMYARDTAQCRDSICQTLTVASSGCAIGGYIKDSVRHTPLVGTSHYYIPVISNGTAPYTYHWSNGSTGSYVYTGFWQSTFNGSVTVTDASGCSAVLHMNSAYVDTFCGNVFNDANGNGVQDAGEAGVAGQVVYLYSGSTIAATATTDAHGHYAIAVHPGTYTIRYTAGTSYAITIPLGTSTSPNQAQYGPFTISSNANNYCGYNFGIRSTNVTITGYVYLDANNNGVFDAGEIPVANQLIHVGPHYAYTNAQGQYTYIGAAGSYAITYAPSSAYSAYTVVPASYSVSASIPGTIYGSNNFGLQQSTTACNITTTIIPITTITAGYPSWYYVYVSNHGTNVASGIMTFYFDPALTFDHASPAPASVNATSHTASFVYAGLQPGTYTSFYVYFMANTTVTVGQSTFEMATATDNCIESNFADNTDTLHQIATGSWDPNAKTVSPAGEGPQGLIRAGQELRYTLNFQNTGTAPAVNVVLRDSLPSTLDPSTIRMLGSSHPDYVVQVEGQQLTCRYSQIMLADSFSSEPESHGFLSFAISPVAGIADGTQIQNTASIYFDYNDAVVTNTTLNTIDYTLSVKDVLSGATITVQPNPFSQYTAIRVTGADMHDATLDVYNALGQLAASATPSSEGVFTLQRNGLSAGMYSYHIRQSGRTVGSGKLVIE